MFALDLDTVCQGLPVAAVERDRRIPAREVGRADGIHPISHLFARESLEVVIPVGAGRDGVTVPLHDGLDATVVKSVRGLSIGCHNVARDCGGSHASHRELLGSHSGG